MFASARKALHAIFDPAFRGVVLKSLALTVLLFAGLFWGTQYGLAHMPALPWPWLNTVLDWIASALLLVAVLVGPAPGYLVGIGLAVGAAFGVGALLLGLAAWRADAVATLGRLVARPFPPRIASLVERLALGFARGLSLVRGGRLLLSLAALSVTAWCLELGLFYVLMASFAIPPSLPLALLGGTAANFATLVPSSPGYVGTFDAALVTVLVDAGHVAVEQAAAYTLLVHATLFLPVVVLGAVILWRSGLSFGQVMRDSVRRGGRSAEMDGLGPAPQPSIGSSTR